MLILVQSREAIINIDRFDVLTVQPLNSVYTITATQYFNGDNDDNAVEHLGRYMEKETAEAVLADIADAARTGQTGYIMPD